MSEDRLKRIEDKVDKVVEHLGSIDITLAKQHVSLQQHMRRTELLESKLEPVEKHVIMVNGVMKFLVLVCTLIGAYAVFIR